MKSRNKQAVFFTAAAWLGMAVALSACSKDIFDRETDRKQTGMVEEIPEKETEEQVQLHDDGSITLAEGFTAHGFYKTDGKLADPGSRIVCEDGVIRGQVHLQQNLPGTMNYGLIVMTDFVQKEFTVECKPYDCYRFSLTDEDEAGIEITVPAGDDAYEMEVLIIPEPDALNFSMDSEDEWNNFQATRGAVSSSYQIIDKNGTARVPHVFDQIDTKSLDEVEHEGNTGFELVESRKEMRVFDSAKAGSRACLCLGGMREEAQAYAVVAFCDWKQTEIAKGELVRCYASVPERNSYDEIIFPNIKEDAVYQMFAFELPLEARPIGLMKQTFRIKLEGR